MPMIHVVLRGAILPLCLLLSLPVLSQDYTVDSVQDGADANPGDGVCASAAGVCTFRAALQEAAVAGAPQVIALPAGTYNWTLGQLDLDEGQITVTCDGARTTIIDADGSSRFFELSGGSTIVEFNDFELRNGFDGNDPGAPWKTTATI